MEIPIGGRRTNALRRELWITVSEPSAASQDAVWAVLSDIRTHAQWGGKRQRNTTRILSLVAPEGPATVGVEFETTGADPMGRFTDRSVVTEATPPATFEFVTEARLETKRGARIDWTLVHRYELTPDGSGCRIDYTVRITRISELIGMLKVFGLPGLSRLAMKAVRERGTSRRAEPGSPDGGTGAFPMKEATMATATTPSTGNVIGRGEGQLYVMPENRIEIKGSGVIEFTTQGGCTLPPHIHSNDDELHYLLEGSAAYSIGDQTFDASAGSLIFLPKRVVHSVVFGDGGARWLWITDPVNEGLADEVAIPALADTPLPSEEGWDWDHMFQAFARYGMEFLNPEA